MVFKTSRAFPASYTDQINYRQGPLFEYIKNILSDERFSRQFLQFTNITNDSIKNEFNYAFMTGLITGLLWGDNYLNMDFITHKPLLALNCDILYSEKRYCEKLLSWFFRIINELWNKINKQDIKNKVTDFNIIKPIIEELRNNYHDETKLDNCVEKLSNQLSDAFHNAQNNPELQSPNQEQSKISILQQPINV